MEILLNSNKNLAKIRILLGPLDWGLGHATRCIPLIREFQKQNIEVIICGEGPVSILIKQEFPEIKILPLQGYHIKYNANKKGFILKMILQLPKIYLAARREHQFLKKIVPQYQINGIISDNRLGFYHKNCSSVFITHQLRIQSGWKWIDALIQKINYYFINQFNECWIPDVAKENNFAGKLSHPQRLPKIPLKYLGLLSRFKKKCVFLEDIIVTEVFRKHGIGKKLFHEVVNVAKQMKVQRLEWQVLNWNKTAIDFYKKLNSNFDDEWVNCKLTGEQIEKY